MDNLCLLPDDRHGAASGGPVQEAARAYGRALTEVGGKELAACAAHDDGDAICVVLYNAPPYSLKVPALGVSRLSLQLAGSRVKGSIGGDRAGQFVVPRHSVFLTPEDASARWSKDSPTRHLNIYFLARTRRGETADSGCLADNHARRLNESLTKVLPGVRSIADDIVAEMAGTDDLAGEVVGCLARLLLIRLARRHATASTSATTELLDRQTLARLADYVDANLSEPIRVADMAAVSGLSVSRFAHAYTSCSGQSPHQFVLARRLRRATELLQSSALSLAEIAATCGFSSQQHLTSLMRRRMGTTPGRFRAQRC